MHTTKRRLLSRIWIVLCLVLAALCWYRYDTGVDRSGWKQIRNGMGYRDFHGRLVTGWQEIDGNHYYFNYDKVMSTHWLEIDGVDYYLGEDGIRVSGWQEIDGHRYFFDSDGVMRTGWQEIDGNLHLFRHSGELATGWLETDEGTYYLSDEGTVTTGFAQLDNDTYYFDETGLLTTGWQKIHGSTYCFRPDGTMVTGWMTVDEYDYYFREDGTMVTGPQVIGGVTHYFTPGGQNVILVNPWNPVPENLEPELVSLSNGQQVDAACYDALTEMLADCAEAGFAPYVCSGYRTQKKQEDLFEKKILRLMKEDKKLTRKKAEALAKTVVAVPGTSEHQLGLAVDIISEESKVLDNTQANTKTQQWIMKHCWEYGFILRYPEDASDITGIIYEPWHYRYVGVELALEIRDLGITLEEYLGAVPSTEIAQAVG